MTPFNFPALHAQLGREIWLAIAWQGALTALGAVGAAGLVPRAGGRTLFEVTRDHLGAWPARLFCLAVATYFLAWTPIGDSPLIAQLVRTSVMPTAPLWLIVLPLVAAGWYAAAFGPEIIGRVCEVWAWVMLPAMAVLAVVPLTLAHWTYLWPPWQPAGSVPITADFWAFGLALRGFTVALPLCGYVRRADRVPRTVLGAAAAGWLVTSLMVLQPHGLFTPPALSQLALPELASMDAVNAESLGVHSFVALSIPVWFVIAFFVSTFTAWAASELLRQALGLADRRWPLVATITFQASAAWPAWAAFAPTLTPHWSLYGCAACVVAPWLVRPALRRRRRARIWRPAST